MQKKLYIFVPIFVIALIITTIITPAIIMSENISNNVFRLHILANSDSEEDQNLKLKVKNAILDSTKDVFSSCNSVDDAITASKQNLSTFEKIANEVIKKNGFDYKANVYITKEYFNTRVYENFTLPAGVYDSLKIEIGEGKGHNWWCVMFPTVCISGCTDDLSKTLTDEEIKMLKSNNYVVRFKIIEIYEKLKSNKHKIILKAYS